MVNRLGNNPIAGGGAAAARAPEITLLSAPRDLEKHLFGLNRMTADKDEVSHSVIPGSTPMLFT